MAKDLEMGYLLDFYGEVLTQKQREMLRQYYNDDLSLSEIGENFGITRQGARDAIKHGETTLKELEEKVGFAARYRRVQQKLEQLEQLVIDTRFECTGPRANITTTEYVETLTKMLEIIRSMEVMQRGFLHLITFTTCFGSFSSFLATIFSSLIIFTVIL